MFRGAFTTRTIRLAWLGDPAAANFHIGSFYGCPRNAMGCLFAPWIGGMIGERVVEGLAVNVLGMIR